MSRTNKLALRAANALVPRARAFLFSDQRGAATTDWVVLTAFIVMIAVPVLVMLRDGSVSSSEDLIVQIRDTSAPTDFGASAEDGVIGYGVDPDALTDAATGSGAAANPALPAVARRTGADPLRRNLGEADDTTDATSSVAPARGGASHPVKVASVGAAGKHGAAHGTKAAGMNGALPVEMIGQSLVLGPGQCFEPTRRVSAPAAAAAAEAEAAEDTARLVLASGR